MSGENESKTSRPSASGEGSLTSSSGVSPTPAEGSKEAARRLAIKIGSQRAEAKGAEVRGASSDSTTEAPAPTAMTQHVSSDSLIVEEEEVGATAEVESAPVPSATAAPATSPKLAEDDLALDLAPLKSRRVSADLQAEIDAALGGLSLDDLMGETTRSTTTEMPTVELDQRCSARVVKCDREFIFFSLGGHQQGIASLRQFPNPPAVGMTLEVVPTKYLADDDLYEVVVPGAAVQVQDWSDLSEGVIVSARVTGHNKGGLECEVNHIRAFMPASQVSLYRVEDFSTYVGQTLSCLVTEANPDRRNLVLSHRAVLEREKLESREKLLAELAVGQTREGIIRRLQNFGAFVDLGGIDGLIPIGALSWDRIRHPSEVVEEGQRVKVRIEKIDPATGKIGLSYRDLLFDPWQDAETNFAVGSVVEGTVSKIMEFGAFVKLAPGVEGLVHISELAHHRVQKVHTVVQEGQTVRVKVLSLDKEAQRLSLSIKAAQAAAMADEEDAAEDPAATAPKPQPKSNKPLQGGLSSRSEGGKFGLNW